MSLVKVIASGLVYIASRELPCLPLPPRLAFAFALPRPNKGGRSFENPLLEYRLVPCFLLVAVPCSRVPLRLVRLVDAIGGRDVKPELTTCYVGPLCAPGVRGSVRLTPI